MTKIQKLVLCFLCLFLLAGCSAAAEEDLQEATEDIFAMDTYMSFTAYGENSQQAVSDAAERVQELDYKLTSENYQNSEQCELYKINETGGGTLSEDVNELLQRAFELNQLTEGAFNPCMYVIMDAWGFPTQNYRVPEAAELEDLLKLTDLSNVQYDSEQRTLKINREGMKIDLGGIAKGYTSQEIVEIFKAQGIESGLINLGGNVQTLGSKPDGTPWRVGIQDPEDGSANIGVISIENKAVITSGGYERYFEENGKRYHHIIDPQTGFPADNDLKSVTIVSADGTLADALSTALFVMGKEQAQEFWKTYGEEYGFEIMLLDEDSNLYISQGIAGDFEPEEGYAVKTIKM